MLSLHTANQSSIKQAASSNGRQQQQQQQCRLADCVCKPIKYFLVLAVFQNTAISKSLGLTHLQTRTS